MKEKDTCKESDEYNEKVESLEEGQATRMVLG